MRTSHQTGVEFPDEHVEYPEESDRECKGGLVRVEHGGCGGGVGGGRGTVVTILGRGGEQLHHQGAHTLCQQLVKQLLL